MSKPSILVVGSMNMDLIIYDVPKLPEYGESIPCGSYIQVPGGKGANQAVAAAKLGADAAMVGCVGDDSFGIRLVENLQNHNVDTSFTIADPEVQTGMAPIMVDKETARYVSYVVMGGNNYVSATQVEQALARRKTDMVLMQLEMPLETVYKTYEIASALGVPVFLDAGPAMNIPLDRLKGIFVISPNEAETKALTGIMPYSETTALQAAEKLYQMACPQYVLLKLGERGAYLYDGKKGKLIPSFSGVKAVDTTAAGDTFGAAFAVSYCGGTPLEEAVEYAHAAAAICVSRKGAQPAIPFGWEVEELIKSAQYTGAAK